MNVECTGRSTTALSSASRGSLTWRSEYAVGKSEDCDDWLYEGRTTAVSQASRRFTRRSPNLSVNQRPASYQKYLGLVVCLSKFHLEIPIICSQIKGPRMLKVRKEPKLLPVDGPGYWFLHICNILMGQRGNCHHRYTVRKSKVCEFGRCRESRTALLRASRRSLARRSHKLRVRRKARDCLEEDTKSKKSQLIFTALSLRRTNIASVFKFALPFQAYLGEQAPMTTDEEEFIEEAITRASKTYNSISLPW